MSTRSIIARVGKGEGEFTGRYHHWDGYPSALGRTLWKLFHGHFRGDLSEMLNVLVDSHPAGWSTIVGKDFSLTPGYSWQNVAYPSGGSDADRARYNTHPDVRRPQCFCHGGRKEAAQCFTHEDLKKNNTGLEWLYAFDEESNRLFVRDISHDAESLIELGEPEPDWTIVECGEKFERCRHYAWFHGLLPKTSNLSTQAWLGNRPLEFRDAIGFIIGGKRYASTGSGGNSDYLRRTSGKNYPRNAWIATVKAKNGKRLDVPVAVIVGDEYKPFPGVIWVMPPTRNNPNETITVIS